MSLIVADSITKGWSDVDVLKNVCATLAPNQRVGLVGPNGHGKTTLVRILVGIEPATSGTVQKKAGLRIGYLPQDPPALEGKTLRDAMVSVFGDLQQIEAEMHDLADKLGHHDADPSILERFGELQHEFEDRGGYSYAHKIDHVLTGLHFPPEMWTMPLAKLSGGQRTRAYLGRLLLEEPDVLMLDEPTNHLDLESVEWLEQWMQSFHGALVVVSHDRYFLDRATTATWEVAFASLEAYKGNYSHYLQQRQERILERTRRWEAQQQFIQETQEFIRRFIAGQRSKEAQGRRTRLERFMQTEAIPRPQQYARISVRLKVTDRTGDFVLRLGGLKAGYGDKPLVSVEKLDIMRGQRVAIVGPNGCGKTTLLRTALGELPPISGTIRLGSNVKPAYLSQTHNELSPKITALEAVREIDPSVTEERARGLLGSLLLSGPDADKKICELSGGQRSRVVLARLMLQRANVLVLDEPTNHLDILSQEALQDVLSEYDGTVIFVSHDRYFIQALATDIWAMHGGTIVPLHGGWDRYVRWRDEHAGQAERSPRQAAAEQASEQSKEDHKDRRKQTNETQRMRRRLGVVETTVHKLEASLKLLGEKISQAGEAGDLDKITRMGQEYTAQEKQLADLLKEWERLSADLEGL